MKTSVVLICSLALASVAYGAQQQENKQKAKKQPQTVQHAPPAATGHAGAGAGPKKTSTASYQPQKSQTSMGAYQGQKGKKGEAPMGTREVKKGQPPTGAYQAQTGKPAKGGKVAGTGKPMEASTTTAGKMAAKGKAGTGKPFKPQHFNVAKQPNTSKAPPVKFQPGRHIEGSQHWHGKQYTVFRNYRSEWHDQNWWHSRYHNNITWVFGAPYYWNSGYWFPAWGYAPNAYYAWDGPIYGYNHLPPDQVIANVQAALQQQGYYHGDVDGLLGPLTRGAIADYQRDHGLYTTSTIDQPTLRSLGMA
jgi:hypothetical protein